MRKCIVILFALFCVILHKVSYLLFDNGKSDFCDYFMSKIEDKTTNKSKIGFADRIVIIWLMVKYKDKSDVPKICRIANFVVSKAENISLKSKILLVVSESAIWELDSELIEWCMEHINNLDSQDADYFRALYAWKVDKNFDVAIKLTSLVDVYDYQIPFVYYYARAQLLESKQNTQDALQNYQIALQTLPLQSDEYTKAIDSCNYLLDV